ncbi:esterase-like activity of phytase family protein [Spongiactinospora rosea]|uniref:Esterase-like activity of phytase family protein n=1 Tax=Spongiactinospora rosea TaxID=2248750 RepID=A0A366LYQ6_9ACTN|nr:esterase-like activity of phytase family protein [Spongiactinospora rosea]RBQ18312.1 esterase-like activity of phytase family protein [Spongiactinospora rosea]
MRNWRTAGLLAVLPLGLATTTAQAAPAAVVQIEITRDLGEQVIPYDKKVDETTVGGLSGLDHDPKTGTWYFISDDRWRHQAPRFYTGKLTFDAQTGKLTAAELTARTWLTQHDGSSYPKYGEKESPDPESIRFDPATGRLLWGTEGHHAGTSHPNALTQLAVRWMNTDGKEQSKLTIPDNLTVTAGTTKGPRTDTGFEGITLTPSGIAAIVEQPLYQDGDAVSAKQGGPVRLTVWKRDGTPAAQYAYMVDALPTESEPADPADNGGVSEVLAIDDHRFLALERSWTKRTGYRVRLYELDVSAATDVLHQDSLRGATYTPATKRLVKDFPSPQNLESMAFGPKFANGECTLIVGSDNNFSADEKTEFLAYAVKGC